MDVRQLVKRLPMNPWNKEDGKQLIRSSGSIGANYLEGNEGVSRKDFVLRLKIAKKESRESGYWLGILDVGSSVVLAKERGRLTAEAGELVRIFGAIIGKVVV